jgi:U2 small nuclear ribonucleoprotein B''
LFQVFSQYGDILEIHARKSFKMKGQAFIVFRDVTSATNAKHALDNTLVFGKPMKVNYSKNISDIVLQQTNQYTHRDKLKRDLERKKRREEEYQELRKKSQKEKEKQISGGVATSTNISKQEKAKTVQSVTQQQMPPNNTLFVENLPADISEPILRSVFSKYNGFKEIRLFSGKGIAFVEYDNEINAGGALLGLNNLNLTTDCVLKISFAKK